MKKILTKIGKELNSKNIKFEELVLSKPVHTVEDVAIECKCEINQVVKTILFIGENSPVLVVLPGNKRVNKSLLESVLRQKIKIATPEQVLLTTSFQVGTVSPFLLDTSSNIISLADESLLETEQIYFGSGESMILILMASVEFKKAFTGKFIGGM